MTDTSYWVVLVGAHCSGKSTCGKALAERLDWLFDEEIGEVLCQGRDVEKNSDEAILEQEMERDRDRRTTSRIVETWHPGNCAWAAWRNAENGVIERMRDAVKIPPGVRVCCFALQCDDDERQKRRNETGRLRLPMEDITDAFAVTGRIGAFAETTATELLEVHKIRTDNRSVEDVVDDMQSRLLEMVLPPSTTLPLFPTKKAALEVLGPAAMILPDLRQFKPCDDLLPYPGLVIVVEGLDGCGKSTLVSRLAPALGGALMTKSPPKRLTEIRAFIDKDVPFRRTDAYHRVKRAFYTLGNYALAEDLQNHMTPAIVDRFASSTLAYTLGSADARDYGWLSSLGPYFLSYLVASSSANAWPRDLPMTDVVLLLQADETVRRARIDKRSHGNGEWERKTRDDPVLGPAIAHRMKTMTEGPPMVIIDANSTEDDVFRRSAMSLVDRGIAIVFRGVVDSSDCEAIIKAVDAARDGRLPKEPLKRHKWDHTNTPYETKRHTKMDICFLKTETLDDEMARIPLAIAQHTGRRGWTVQDAALPVFSYGDTGSIRPHRDVNVTPETLDFAAVVMLTQRKTDFLGGDFFVNKSVTTFDDQGYFPLDEMSSKRQYFRDLDQGDIVVFRNSLTIHGVDSVKALTSRGRMTASWRI